MHPNQYFLKQIERNLKLRNYSTATIKAYQSCIKIFLSKNKNSPLEITKEEIEDFLLSLQAQKKSPKTINLYKESIKYFYNEILESNLKININFSKEAKKIPIVLTRSDIKKIIDSIKNPKHKFIISIAYGAGLRVSEIINLKIWDFNLENLTIHIKSGKGQKDRITVFPKKLKKDILKLSWLKKAKDLLIESERWWKLTTRSLQKIFKTALKKAKINKPATFHSLRHSFATHLLENWVDIRYVQKLLWHSNIRTTQIYTKITNPHIYNIKSPL